MKNNDESIRKILRDMKKMKYISPDEIPNIDLYMDQMTSFMDEHLKYTRRSEDDKMLTKTMINNYTKNNLLPPSNKKKYSKEHVLLLIFIYYFKNILSISDIQHLCKPLTERFFSSDDEDFAGIDLQQIYEEVFQYEKGYIDPTMLDVLRKYRKAKDSFPGDVSEEDREFLTTFSLICSLSFDVYVKKMIVQKLIDEQLLPNEEEREEMEHKAEHKPERKTDKKADGKNQRKQERIRPAKGEKENTKKTGSRHVDKMKK